MPPGAAPATGSVSMTARGALLLGLLALWAELQAAPTAGKSGRAGSESRSRGAAGVGRGLWSECRAPADSEDALGSVSADAQRRVSGCLFPSLCL